MNIANCNTLLIFILAVFTLQGCNRDGADEHVASGATGKPNIIYILADDAGIGDLTTYNPNSKIPTPSLDRLASDGVKFTDAHTPSSVCTPTRYSVLTGRYSWRSRLKRGVLEGYDPALIEPDRLTVADLLKRQGYVTAGIGKWHLGLGDQAETDYSAPLIPGPASNGFDYYFGIPASLDMPPYVYFENDTVITPATYTIGTNGVGRGAAQANGGGVGYWRGGAIAEDFNHIEVLPTIADKTVQFIQQQAASSGKKPFFIYMPLPAPHQPWLPKDEFRGRSEAGVYGDFMVQVDSVVGQVMSALEKAGIKENTLVVFTSDNGSHWYNSDIQKYDHYANLHYRGHKGDIYEGGHRVPFIVSWPNSVPKNKTSKEIISLTDFMATAAAIAGIELPQGAGEDSYNMLPILLGNETDSALREATVMHSVDGTFAIRQGPWKLIDGAGSGGFGIDSKNQSLDLPAMQLYNLDEDPSESSNVYARHPEIVTALKTLLETYKTQDRSVVM